MSELDSYTGDLAFLTDSHAVCGPSYEPRGGNGAGFGVYKYFALIITILTETVINICQAIQLSLHTNV